MYSTKNSDDPVPTFTISVRLNSSSFRGFFFSLKKIVYFLWSASVCVFTAELCFLLFRFQVSVNDAKAVKVIQT